MPEDRLRLRTALRLARRRAEAVEFHVTGASGETRLLACLVRRIPRSRGGGLLGVCQDVTEPRRQELRLSYMATHDRLTGLPNRWVLEEALERAVSRARRGERAALMLVDLDNFKAYNDTFGHVRGDQALVNAALLMLSHLRAGDLLARVGGDEFAVLIEKSGVEEATDVADRMTRAGEEEFVEGARAVSLGFSIGIIGIDGSRDHVEILEAVDLAMYAAKESGRSRVRVYQPGELPEPGVVEGIDLQDMLQRGEIAVEFQPVVRLGDRVPVYSEALARVVARDGRVLSPASFLPTVERLGLCTRLTRLVLDRALEEMARDPLLETSVNVTAEDIADSSFGERLSGGLAERGVAAGRLRMEIDERSALRDGSKTLRWARTIGEIGMHVTVADFGRTFDRLATLMAIPADEFKVAGQVSARAAEDPRQGTLARALRELAESGGARAVATRIEDETALSSMIAAGFRFGQGYALGRPGPKARGPYSS